MADQEVPDLDLAGALTGAEVFHIVQDGNSRRVPLSMITGFGGGTGFDPDIIVRVGTQSPGTFATDFVAGAVVDGETLELGEDILIKDQVDLSENGVFIVPASGPPARSTYVDTSGELAGILVLVTEGSNNANSLWRCTNEEPIVVDTDDIIFARISAGGGFPVPGTDYGDIIADQFNNLLVQNSVLEVNNFMGSAFVTSDEGLLSQVDNATFATTQAIVAYVEGEISDFADTLPDVLWLGGIDCSIDPDYPEATAGQVRYASLAGTLGDRQIQYGSIIYALVDTYGGDYNDAGVDFAVLPRNPVQRVGQIDCTANPNYPPATKGQFWLVIPGGDGKIGGASGRDVAEGDWIVADSDNAGGTEASVGANWSIIHMAGGGGATAFLDLTDVDDTGLADGDVWVWDASAAMLVPTPLGGGVTFATVPEIWEGDETAKAISPATFFQHYVPQSLTYGATVTPNLDGGRNRSLTLTGDCQINLPSNGGNGEFGFIRIVQDSTGGHTVTFGSGWTIQGPGTVSTAADSETILMYYMASAVVAKGMLFGEDDASAALTQTAEPIAGFIASPSDKTYKLVVKMPHGGTITETTTISASGTCTATFKINTTALGGTANSVSSGEQSQSHGSSNVFSAGDDIQLTVSSNSSCADMSWSIKYTRTLE